MFVMLKGLSCKGYSPMSEMQKDAIKKKFFVILAWLLCCTMFFGAFFLVYIGHTDEWTNYEVTVQGETYECDAYKLSDEEIVLYRYYYTQNSFDSNVVPYKTIEISKKSDVEIKEFKTEDYKGFFDWLIKDYFSFNSDVEYGR